MLSGNAASAENPQNINTPFYSSLKEGVAVQGMDVLTHLGQKATKLVRAIATAEPSSSKARSHRFTTSVPSKWETLQDPMKTPMKSVLWKPCTFCRVTAVWSHHPSHQRTLWVRSCFHRNKWDFFIFFFTQKQQERILCALHSALLRGAFLRSAWKKVRKISMEDKNSKPTWKRTGKQKQF